MLQHNWEKKSTRVYVLCFAFADDFSLFLEFPCQPQCFSPSIVRKLPYSSSKERAFVSSFPSCATCEAETKMNWSCCCCFATTDAAVRSEGTRLITRTNRIASRSCESKSTRDRDKSACVATLPFPLQLVSNLRERERASACEQMQDRLELICVLNGCQVQERAREAEKEKESCERVASRLRLHASTAVARLVTRLPSRRTQIGFILYNPMAGAVPWSDHDHNQMMLVTSFFVMHMIADLGLLALVACLIHRCSCCHARLPPPHHPPAPAAAAASFLLQQPPSATRSCFSRLAFQDVSYQRILDTSGDPPASVLAASRATADHSSLLHPDA